MLGAEMTVIRIPYVKAYIDRHGHVRRYFRKRGSKPTLLPGVPGSAEFMEAYRIALGEPAPRPAARHGEGTVSALIFDYLKSAAFANLKPSSQAAYRVVLDRFGIAHGHRMVHDMPRAKVAAYIHEIGAKRPGMGNLTRKVLRRLLAHAVRLGYRNDNPITEIDTYKLGTRHTWTDIELATFEARWPLGTRERLAYALLLHTRCENATGGHRWGDDCRRAAEDRHCPVDPHPSGANSRAQSRTGERPQPDWRDGWPTYYLGESDGLDQACRRCGWAAGSLSAPWPAQGADAAARGERRFDQADRGGLWSQDLAGSRALYRRR
jgi:hypothetical protein